MKPSHAERARYRLVILSGVLLSLAMLAAPTVAAAADTSGDNAPAATAGPVVLRGTRPVSETPAAAPKTARERTAAAPYMGFVPAPYFGSGWDTGVSTEGLNYTPPVTPQLSQ